MEPKFEIAYNGLMFALEEMSSWDDKAKQANILMRDMLESRKSIAEVATQHDIRSTLCSLNTVWASL